MKVSIIIPTLNEKINLEKTLPHLEKMEDKEIIIVDGGSTDNTASVAKRYADKLLLSCQDRGIQMNTAAHNAEGDMLLFLHADSELSTDGYNKLLEASEVRGIAGGAFYLAIDSKRFLLKFISLAANLRSKLFRIAYGDQGIFVRRDIFVKIGGFNNLPLFEDADLFRRLKREGEVIFIKSILTSARRWDGEGALYTTFRNMILASFYFLGFSPQTLIRWYPNVR